MQFLKGRQMGGKNTYPDGNEVAFSRRSANGWQKKLFLIVTKWHFMIMVVTRKMAKVGPTTTAI